MIIQEASKPDFLVLDGASPKVVVQMENKTELLVITSSGPPGKAGVDSGTSIDLVMTTHIQAPAPHPAYDDQPDLTLIFQNGLI